jgi:hypothetical protein
VKKTALSLLFILILGCTPKEQFLTGTWKLSEERYGGNSGEKVYVKKVANKTYTFKDDNKLTLIADGIPYEGVYEVIENKKDIILHTITNSAGQPRVFDRYFRVHFTDSITFKKLSFIPIHPDNEVMYSVGRADTYERQNK